MHEFTEDEFDTEKTALILVDIRNIGMGPAPLHPNVSRRDEHRQAVGVSLIDRSCNLVEENIIPAVKAARRIGIPIIHEANTPKAIATPQYQDWFEPDPPPPGPGWPPGDVAKRNNDELFNRRFGAEKKDRVLPLYDLVVPIEENDYVVSTCSSVQKVLKRHGAEPARSRCGRSQYRSGSTKC